MHYSTSEVKDPETGASCLKVVGSIGHKCRLTLFVNGPKQGEMVLTGHMTAPERADFEFDGPAGGLRGLIERSSNAHQVILNRRFTRRRR